MAKHPREGRGGGSGCFTADSGAACSGGCSFVGEEALFPGQTRDSEDLVLCLTLALEGNIDTHCFREIVLDLDLLGAQGALRVSWA